MFTSDPDAPWCRWCAGTGIRHDAPDWLRQIVTRDAWVDERMTVTMGPRPAKFIGPVRAGEPLMNDRSFYEWVLLVDHYRSQDPHALHPALDEAADLSFMCLRCLGTGRYHPRKEQRAHTHVEH